MEETGKYLDAQKVVETGGKKKPEAETQKTDCNER